MPYRAVWITVVNVLLVLLATGLWMRSIAPMTIAVNTSTQPTAEHPGVTFPTTSATQADRPDRQFKGLVKATMIAIMMILGLLFAIGFFVTLRTWMRSPGKPRKSRYVDAWKLAGERLEVGPDAGGPADPGASGPN